MRTLNKSVAKSFVFIFAIFSFQNMAFSEYPQREVSQGEVSQYDVAFFIIKRVLNSFELRECIEDVLSKVEGKESVLKLSARCMGSYGKHLNYMRCTNFLEIEVPALEDEDVISICTSEERSNFS